MTTFENIRKHHIRFSTIFAFILGNQSVISMCSFTSGSLPSICEIPIESEI